MFDPDEKRSQHYVPVFWQRRFAGDDGDLWALRDGAIAVAGAKNLMCEDWLYTTFNPQWVASNALEGVASRREHEAAGILRNLDSPNSLGTTHEQLTLRYFIAFSACRHPDTMAMGYRRGKQLALLIAQVHTLDPGDFARQAEKFGLSPTDSALIISTARNASPEQLAKEAMEIDALIPQHPALPKQLAISNETIEQVFFRLAPMNITIVEATNVDEFVLGDTPFPTNLIQGFTLPLSRRLALIWRPGGTELFPDWTRRLATSNEVLDSNLRQAENALKVVVGSSREVLQRIR